MRPIILKNAYYADAFGNSLGRWKVNDRTLSSFGVMQDFSVKTSNCTEKTHHISGAEVIDHCKPLFRNWKIITNIYIFKALTTIRQNINSFNLRSHKHHQIT